VPETTNNAKEPGFFQRHGVLVTVLLAGATGLGVWMMGGRSAGPALASDEGHDKATLHLEPFVLNVADSDQRAYLRVGIDLGLDRELKRTPEGPPVARVRDTVLGVFEQAKLEELQNSKGKEQLKQDTLHALQQRVPELGVQEVYFTEFLIQK